MKPKYVSCLAGAILLLSSVIVLPEMKPKPISEVLDKIRQEQGVKKNEDISADKVSLPMLEMLGDSVMEVMAGSSERHEQMDKMMGGDGSESLAAMHRRIGYNYLAGYPVGMMNMMGAPGYYSGGRNFSDGGRFMMGGNYHGMMGFPGWRYGGMLMGFVFFIIFLIIIFIIVRLSMRHFKNADSQSPLDILKKRYAKGEISKDEYERMKQDIL